MTAMTVGELFEKLRNIPLGTKVILEDSEFGHGPVTSVVTGFSYAPINSWHGEVHGPDDKDDMDGQETIPCVIIS